MVKKRADMKRRQIEYFPESKNAGIIKIILFAFILLLVAVSIVLIIKMDIFSFFFPSEPVELNVSLNNMPTYKNPSFGNVQFYPNMKFNHNAISYSVDISCLEDKKLRIRKAFELLSNEISN